MTSRAEVLCDRTIGGEEPLGVSWGLEPLHPSLSLASRLVGVLGAVIEIAMLPMFVEGVARVAWGMTTMAGVLHERRRTPVRLVTSDR
jgi:hypothetical protein